MTSDGIIVKVSKLIIKSKGKQPIKRLVSLFLSTVLLWPSFGWSFYPTTVNAVTGQNLVMPEQYGRITARALGRPKMVFIVQDLHCHAQVQHHIAKIIEYLHQQQQVTMVAVEGAMGKIDTTSLGAVPLQTLREQIGRYFVKQGLITGAEYFDIVHPEQVSLIGLEDESLYQQSRKAINEFFNAESLGLVYDLREQLNALEPTSAHIEAVIQQTVIMEKLLNISATEDEVETFLSNREAFTLTAIMAHLPQDGQKVLDPYLFQLDDYLEQVSRFYHLTERRSQAFVTVLQDHMSRLNQSSAIMVTGGYHTNQVMEALKQKNIGYVVIEPRLDQRAIVNPYFDLLQHKLTPLEQLLAKNQINLALLSRFMQPEATAMFRLISKTIIKTMIKQQPLSALDRSLLENFLAQQKVDTVQELEQARQQQLPSIAELAYFQADGRPAIFIMTLTGRRVPDSLHDQLGTQAWLAMEQHEVVVFNSFTQLQQAAEQISRLFSNESASQTQAEALYFNNQFSEEAFREYLSGYFTENASKLTDRALDAPEIQLLVDKLAPTFSPALKYWLLRYPQQLQPVFLEVLNEEQGQLGQLTVAERDALQPLSMTMPNGEVVAGEVMLRRISGFRVPLDDTLTKLEQGKPILAAMVDADGEFIQVKYSFGRQPILPLNDGTMIGIKGGGKAGDLKLSGMQLEAGNTKDGLHKRDEVDHAVAIQNLLEEAFGDEAKWYPFTRLLAWQPMKRIPDGQAYFSSEASGQERYNLTFFHQPSPFRFNKWPIWKPVMEKLAQDMYRVLSPYYSELKKAELKQDQFWRFVFWQYGQQIAVIYRAKLIHVSINPHFQDFGLASLNDIEAMLKIDPKAIGQAISIALSRNLYFSQLIKLIQTSVDDDFSSYVSLTEALAQGVAETADAEHTNEIKQLLIKQFEKLELTAEQKQDLTQRVEKQFSAASQHRQHDGGRPMDFSWQEERELSGGISDRLRQVWNWGQRHLAPVLGQEVRELSMVQYRPQADKLENVMVLLWGGLLSVLFLAGPLLLGYGTFLTPEEMLQWGFSFSWLSFLGAHLGADTKDQDRLWALGLTISNILLLQLPLTWPYYLIVIAAGLINHQPLNRWLVPYLQGLTDQAWPAAPQAIKDALQTTRSYNSSPYNPILQIIEYYYQEVITPESLLNYQNYQVAPWIHIKTRAGHLQIAMPLWAYRLIVNDQPGVMLNLGRLMVRLWLHIASRLGKSTTSVRTFFNQPLRLNWPATWIAQWSNRVGADLKRMGSYLLNQPQKHQRLLRPRRTFGQSA